MRLKRNKQDNPPDTNGSTPDNERSPREVLRAVQHLVDRFELSTETPVPRTIAVVGPRGGEGVTTIARALAEVLHSSSRNSVCRVDLGTDGLAATSIAPQRPDLRPLNTAEPSSGSTKNGSLARPEHSTPSLPDHTRPDAYLYASPARSELKDALEELSSKYHHVVLDMPPLQSSDQALGLLRHADAYLLVTRHGETSLNQVSTLTEELRSVDLLGVVLNDYRTRTPRYIRSLFSE